MNISNPSLAGHLKQSAQQIVSALYESDFASTNVDLSVDMVGILNYTTGVKLRMSFVDSFEDDDIDEWRRIAFSYGATGMKTRVDTSSGNIDLNIEYKRRDVSTKLWWIRSATILLATWSYHQLHLVNHERYPWFE